MNKNNHNINEYVSELGRHILISDFTRISTLKSNILAKMGLYTVKDLLLHFPLRYEDRTRFCLISELVTNMYATVRGKILCCLTNLYDRRTMTCQINDGSGTLTIRFFNFNPIMKNSFIPGRFVLVYGKTKYNNSHHNIEMIHPEFHIQKDYREIIIEKTLTPIYQTTKGIKQITLRKLTEKALNFLDSTFVAELLPPEIKKEMMTTKKSLSVLHRPPSSLTEFNKLNQRKHPAQQRLVTEELLAYNLSILALRKKKQHLRAYALSNVNHFKKKFLSSLPFQLTNAQLKVVEEIEKDMSLDHPMMRLVQGDVGSGKTIVAALAALYVIAHGKQVVLMAPTELLAEQHVHNFQNWFSPFKISVDWLIGKQTRKTYLAKQNTIANGQIQMIVGTHAIFQDKVNFLNLALIIIDEQHRFGVYQRFMLWKKGFYRQYYPHQLVMTATPIPRTLSMVIYADFDMSVINEIPPGRTPIVTLAIPNTRRKDIINRIRYTCIKTGRQVYWVCTLIDESTSYEVKTVLETWKELKSILPELNIGLIHGRMKLSERQEIIRRFRKGYLNILVCTTIIEVGMDVPNSSIMIIDNPERLGLVQLHQLRGRVGRSTTSSYCILLYESPLSQNAKQRLQILRENNNGFIIAEKDLEIRGPGDLLGTRQTGNIKFKIVNLFYDKGMISQIRYFAKYMHEHYPDQAKALINRWIPTFRSH